MRALLIGIGLALTSGATLQSGGEAPTLRVALEFVADRTRLVGGETFELAVRWVAPPGAHIGWTNPGENGMATDVTLTTPDGFAVEGPLHPGPSRFDEPGDVVHYGWSGEATAVYRVTPPTELVEDTHYTFAISSRWLACTDKRTVGEGQRKLSLESADAAHGSQAANTELFARAHARLPRPWSELGDAARVEWSLGKEGVTHMVVFRIEGADRLEFCPAGTGGFDFLGRMLGIDRDFATVTVKMCASATPTNKPRLVGVLRVDRGKDRRWYAVDLPKPTPPGPR
jgi:DsbC/DsbD-like thiol-disulfide interchange protein